MQKYISSWQTTLAGVVLILFAAYETWHQKQITANGFAFVMAGYGLIKAKTVDQ
jgi:hypothetical protein